MCKLVNKFSSAMSKETRLNIEKRLKDVRLEWDELVLIKKELGEFLAILNRDGGHYERNNGTVAAIKRGRENFEKLRDKAGGF